MAVLNILEFPDKRLRTVAKEVEIRRQAHPNTGQRHV